MGEGLDGDCKSTGKAKVADLDVPGLCDKKVLWLQISMDNPLRMAVVNTPENLVQHLLYLQLRDIPLLLSHVFLQVIVNVFKNQIQLLFLRLKHYLL